MQGDVVAGVAFGELGSPAIWKPSTGGVALSWVSSGKQRFGLSSASFEGTSQTGPELTLEVVIGERNDVQEFRSVDGSSSSTG